MACSGGDLAGAHASCERTSADEPCAATALARVEGEGGADACRRRAVKYWAGQPLSVHPSCCALVCWCGPEAVHLIRAEACGRCDCGSVAGRGWYLRLTRLKCFACVGSKATSPTCADLRRGKRWSPGRYVASYIIPLDLLVRGVRPIPGN